jgi:hypothetical protein
VIECYDTGAQNKNLLILVSKAIGRAAKYYKVSQCSITKTRKKGKTHPNEVIVQQERRGKGQKIATLL